MPEQITEAGTVTPTQAGPAAGRSIAVDLITPGWGSSGYYAPQVLEAAGRDRIFPAGTHMYIDHPSVTEDMDRPERSVRDLAAVTTTDATWNGQALTAEARVFAPYQQLLSEAKDAIGVSIRAGGDIELGEAEGRKGRIVTKLIHGTSADFVTRAGRGGRIRQLLESARNLTEARNVGQHFESRLHQDFTNRADEMAAQGHLTRDERIHLSSAVGKGLTAFAGHLEEHAPQLYTRDIYDEPTASRPDVSESATTPVPANPGAVTPNTPKEGLVPELTEAEVTALRDQAARAEAAERQLAESNARIAAMEASAAARPLIAAHLSEAAEPLPAPAQARVVEHVLAAGVPTRDGAVDTAALNTAVEAAAATEAAYLAAITPTAPVRESFGVFGSQQVKGATAVAEADAIKAYDEASARTFGRTITGA